MITGSRRIYYSTSFYLFVVLKFLYGICAGDLVETGDITIPSSVQGSHRIFAILVGIFSSALGGISYCLIQAGAQASDHPVYEILPDTLNIECEKRSLFACILN